MHGIGEIDGTRSRRQHHHASLRREAVDFFRVQVELQCGVEIGRIADLLLPLHQLPEPRDPLIVLRAALALLVLPVRRDALFRDPVHLFRADLDLAVLAFRPHHRSMQRLIKIGPRDGDEILDPPRHRAPFVVDHAQSAVAVFYRVGNDAEREQIVHLIERDLLALDLLIHGKSALDASIDTRRNTFAPQFRFDGAAHAFEKFFVGRTLAFDGLRNLRVSFRIEMLEGEIFEFAAHFTHAQPVRDRGVNLERLARDAFAPLQAERA